MNIVLDHHSAEEIRVQDLSKRTEPHLGKTEGLPRYHGKLQEKTNPAFRRDHAQVLPGQEREKNSALIERQAQKGQETMRKMELVLSHTLSSADYQKAKQEGFDWSKIDFDQAVTIMDHIKAAVLAGGEEVSGFTDRIDLKKLEEITGSASRAIQLKNSFEENDLPLTEENLDAVKKVVELNEKLKEPSSEAIHFLLENQSEISLKNLYVAEHACAEGKWKSTQDQKAEDEKQNLLKDPNLQGQIRNLIQDAGLSGRREEAEDTAKELFLQGTPLTKDNLKAAVDLKSVTVPLSFTELTKLAAGALANGEKPQDCSFIKPGNLYRKAQEIEKQVRSITEDQLSEVLQNGKDLTIQNLTEAKGVRGQGGIELLSARRQLEEVRLAMSAEVNLVMLRKGIQIDTVPMKKLIQELDRAIEEKAASLFGGSAPETEGEEESKKVEGCVAKYRLYLETNAKVESFKELPLGVLGAMKDTFEEDTLDDIFTGAQTWKLRNKTAQDLYEQMQTEVRADLGDDIKKAFARIDSLLEENGFDVNEENRRAVRALGRNRMDISAENLSAVRAMDSKLRQVVHCLKPGAVLEMIRENKNPLKMTIEELAEYFRQKQKDPQFEEEKYANFLYKLDRTGGITEAERESYIGIYRLFANLEKTDHAAIAYLLNTGAEMTVKNLLGAQRSLQTSKKGINVKADQNFAGLDLLQNQSSIDEQIASAFSYYGSKSSHIFSLLEPEKLHAMKRDRNQADPEEATLVELDEAMQETDGEEALGLELEQAQRAELRKTLDHPEEAGKLLEESGISVSVDHLLGAKKVLQNRSRKGNRHLVVQEEAFTGQQSELRKLLPALGEVEDYPQFYREKMEQVATKLHEVTENETKGFLDIKAITLLHKQLSVMSAMANKDHFEIPLESENGMISMSVTLRRGGEKQKNPEAEIVLEVQEGNILRANLRADEGISIIEIELSEADCPENKRKIEELKERFSELFGEEKQGKTSQVKELLMGAKCLVKAALPLYVQEVA